MVTYYNDYEIHVTPNFDSVDREIESKLARLESNLM